MITKENILKDLSKFIDENYFVKAVISNPIKKDISSPKKIDIKKIILKNNPCFQISYYIDKKVIHENLKDISVLEKIISLMEDSFKQCDILANNSLTILMNKKGNFKITGVKKAKNVEQISSHNKTKNYILKDGEYIEWLHKLNVMDKNGIVLSHMQKNSVS